MLLLLVQNILFMQKNPNPKETKLCPAWCEKEGVARAGYRRTYLCRHISHKPYHWHTLEYTPFPLFYVDWSPPDQTAQMSYSVTCPYCAWAHTGGNRKPWSIIWIPLKHDSKWCLTAKLSALKSKGLESPCQWTGVFLSKVLSTKSIQFVSSTIASSHPAWLKAH